MPAFPLHKSGLPMTALHSVLVLRNLIPCWRSVRFAHGRVGPGLLQRWVFWARLVILVSSSVEVGSDDKEEKAEEENQGEGEGEGTNCVWWVRNMWGT